jgi:predicted nucleotide-binding protein (sugar kinase/HSP70/actin superfamily)
LNKDLELQEAQLSTLKNLFASGEDGVAVQKEIMRLIEESGNKSIQDLLVDKGADLVVAGVLEAIKLWLVTRGVSLS